MIARKFSPTSIGRPFAPLAPIASILLAASISAAPEVRAHATTDGEAPLAGVALLNLEGEQVAASELAGDQVLVLAYTGVDCPISGKYAARLTRLAAEYGERGVRFYGVNANPHDSRAAIREEIGELELGLTVLKDFRQELTRALGAETTTETYVFDASGRLRYEGAVDDQYTLGAARPAPTKRFLSDALDAVLAGEEPPVSATDAPGCKLTLMPEDELPGALTWSRDIAPILQRNCETCHRPGQVGPFRLDSYEKARGWGEMIASVVSERRMPPWNAHERFDGVFYNERGLRAPEREKIVRWVEEGMALGDPDEAPAPVQWSDDWRIGTPDAVFAMDRDFYEGTALPDEGYRVPRENTVEYQYFAVDTGFTEDKWIRAMEVRPGAAEVVHHVLIAVDDPAKGSFGERDLLNYLAVAVPGDTPSIYPEGYAKLLPAGATLVFQMHYTPNGKEAFDRSSVAMIFADEPPIFEVVSQAVIDQSVHIPAGAENHEWRSDIVFQDEAGIISFFPHMHTRGKDFQYIAHYPDGSQEELLFTDYDFNWQESYIYPDPIALPAGTRLECIAHYDNSAGNPNNPDPNAPVYWGEQTWEEMFVGYFDRVIPLF